MNNQTFVISFYVMCWFMYMCVKLLLSVIIVISCHQWPLYGNKIIISILFYSISLKISLNYIFVVGNIVHEYCFIITYNTYLTNIICNYLVGKIKV